MQEWSSPFNPFNSWKSLVWADRFESLARGEIPPPVSVTIDPTNVCNLVPGCIWCHSADWRARDHSVANEDRLLSLANMIGAWQGVRAVCIAGGGEPLMNKATPILIEYLIANNLQVGMITNGILLKGKALETARFCRWVGFSVDAATPWTYSKLKGQDRLEVVVKNVATLALQNPHPSIGYKFLLHPENIRELYAACYIAREIGVNDFHARPLYMPGLIYTEDQVQMALDEITRARDNLENEHFHIYGIQHKFGGHFERKLPQKCLVTPLAGLVFQADGFTTLCCDRRGDMKVVPWEKIRDFWGSSEHQVMIEDIYPEQDCKRRCTFSVYMEILEKVFIEDRTFRAFI